MTTPISVDPTYFTHPKIARAGPLAALLHLSATAYCAQHLTDGYIPTAVVPTLVNLDGISTLESEGRLTPTLEPALHRDLVDRLVVEGLFESAPGGFLVHDYLDWNPSRAEVTAAQHPDPRRRGGYMKAARQTLSGPPAETTPETEWDGGGGVDRPPELFADRAREQETAAPKNYPWEISTPEQDQTQEPETQLASTRRELFTALARAAGSEPGSMTRREARATGVALSEIRRADRDVTPEEITRRAANYRRHFPGAALTANALANHWSRCARPPANAPGPRDRAREILEAAKARG